MVYIRDRATTYTIMNAYHEKKSSTYFSAYKFGTHFFRNLHSLIVFTLYIRFLQYFIIFYDTLF